MWIKENIKETGMGHLILTNEIFEDGYFGTPDLDQGDSSVNLGGPRPLCHETLLPKIKCPSICVGGFPLPKIKDPSLFIGSL